MRQTMVDIYKLARGARETLIGSGLELVCRWKWAIETVVLREANDGDGADQDESVTKAIGECSQRTAI
jgi:hypothetical protein